MRQVEGETELSHAQAPLAPSHVSWSAQAEGGAVEGVPYYALAPLFMLSVTMGLAFERTKHIGVPIVMHAAFNALNIALVVATSGGAEPPA